jgi:hypothetical protein
MDNVGIGSGPPSQVRGWEYFSVKKMENFSWEHNSKPQKNGGNKPSDWNQKSEKRPKRGLETGILENFGRIPTKLLFAPSNRRLQKHKLK